MREFQKERGKDKMTCKDCVHYEVCKDDVELHHDFYDCLEVDGVENHCEYFKPKSRFVELPCEVGQTVYSLIGGFAVEMKLKRVILVLKPNDEHPLDYIKEIEDFGKTVFLTKEETEKALAERSK